jgi:CRP/FNR family cyclic AMP-dependent transcriptional regulator
MSDQGSDAARPAFVLREIELFRDLTDDEVAGIGAAAPMRQAGAGQILYSPATPTEVLFILRAGRVRLYTIGAEGRSLTTAIVEPGDVFGEMAALGQSLAGMFAETLEPTTLCVMSRADVDRLLLADPRIAARIAGLLGRRVAELERRLADVVLKSAPDRVASTLTRMADRDGATIRLTHEQLAELVGTTRETVTKVLGDLSALGLVHLRRGRIVIKDSQGLRELVTIGGPSSATGGYRR